MNVLDYRHEDAGSAFDLSGVVTHVCPCGSDMWRVIVSFSDYEISSYMLDMECLYCGTRATAPTPLDNPEYEEDL